MKRRLSVFLLPLSLLLTLALPRALAAAPEPAEAKVEVCRFTGGKLNRGNEYAVLRFFPERPNVPYIAVDDFYAMVYPGRSMTVSAVGNRYTLRCGGETATVDVERDTLSFRDLMAFTNLMGQVQPGMDNVYYDGYPFIRYLRTIADEPEPVTLDFHAYGIDLIGAQANICTVYFPLSLLSNLYSDLYYHYVSYNGKAILVNADCDSPLPVSSSADFYAPVFAQTQRGEDLAEYSYGELCFLVDTLYGYPGRTTLEEIESETGRSLDAALDACGPEGREIKRLLRSRATAEYLLGLTLLDSLLSDGGHTALNAAKADGLLRNADTPLCAAYAALDPEYGGTPARDPALSALLRARQDAVRRARADAQSRKQLRLYQRNAVLGSNRLYVKKGDTAIFLLDSFDQCDRGAWDAYYAAADPSLSAFRPTQKSTGGEDLIAALADALRTADADPEVKSFVLDLTQNSGGSLDLALTVASLLTGESRLRYQNALTGQRQELLYRVDRNFDRVFDALDDEVSYDLRFAVLTSADSFSCANLLPALLREQGIPVLGERSGGGACALQIVNTAQGFSFPMSSFRARLADEAWNSIDGGVEPDVPISSAVTLKDGSIATDYSAFYDLEALSGLIDAFYSPPPEEPAEPVLPPPKTFADVPEEAWYAESVGFVTGLGLLSGTDLGFEPDLPMTRAMTVQALYNIAADPAAEESPAFRDVSPDSWYAGAVAWAAGRGLVLGYDGLFSPDAPVSRQDLLTILHRVAISQGLDVSAAGLLSFPDAGDAAAYAIDSLAWAADSGILTGDGSLSPAQNATRAQTAVFLRRFVQWMTQNTAGSEG